MRRPGAALAALLLALLVSGFAGGDRAEAGMVSSCDEPAVFPGAALNVVVLPYKADLGAGRPVSGPAENLGLLLQLNSLLTLGRYGSLGAVYLHSRPDRDECPEALVEDQLLDKRPGASSTVRPGKALLLLWGRIYQEGNDIYLQSYLRFLRRGEVDGVTRRLPGGGILRGRTPAQQIAFPPRRLTEQDLLKIQEEVQRVARVYDQPRESAPSTPLPIENHAPVAFGVDRVEGDWLQISGAFVGTGKWLKARVDPREWPLRQKLPELDFLDAVAGYLQYRVGTPGPGHPKEAIPRWVAESLGRYREASREEGPSPVPEAVGQALLGNLQMLSGHPEAAEPLYHRVAELLPYSADARNLEAVARLSRISDADLSKRASQEAAVWLDALALEPANLDVVENLAAIYGLGLRAEKQLHVATKTSLAGRLAAVERVRAAILAKRPPEFGAPPPPPP